MKIAKITCHEMFSCASCNITFYHHIGLVFNMRGIIMTVTEVASSLINETYQLGTFNRNVQFYINVSTRGRATSYSVSTRGRVILY